ncbi:hypothetical protein GCM10010532_089670 [Dactylosporangium siamense]|uniref:Uncharacterized protein n=1 Tax=Dactylosporangium siamense TaxID=685454 RepID=A0A919PW54_9ACTN|nr:hypothetical protein Dsi01nite_077290 [Dactylosporangium siamense]
MIEVAGRPSTQPVHDFDHAHPTAPPVRKTARPAVRQVAAWASDVANGHRAGVDGRALDVVRTSARKA